MKVTRKYESWTEANDQPKKPTVAKCVQQLETLSYWK